MYISVNTSLAQFSVNVCKQNMFEESINFILLTVQYSVCITVELFTHVCVCVCCLHFEKSHEFLTLLNLLTSTLKYADYNVTLHGFSNALSSWGFFGEGSQ